MKIAATILVLGLAIPLRAGDDTLNQNVNVKVCTDSPLTVTLAASPIRISPGHSTTLSWTTNRAASLTLTDVGAVTGNSITQTPAGTGDKTYTLAAVDECGKTGSASVTVTVGVLKVFLSASVYCGTPTVEEYLNYNLFTYWGYYGTHNIDGDTGAGLAEFKADMKSWPRSADVFNQAHVGGQTDVIDENGAVVGHFSTNDIWAHGIPGFSYQGDPWAGDSYPKNFVCDETLVINNVEYEVVGFNSVSPIILDLKGDGKPDVDRGEWLPHATRFNRSHAVVFDIDATGFPSVTEWIGPKDGLLVAPAAGGRAVKGGENLFGNPIGYIDGYQKLGLLYDKNGNGVVEGKELQGLMVWQDLNGNGRADPGELKTVQELGITKLSTQHTNLKSTFVINGQSRATWDWWPTCMMVYPKPVAQAPAESKPKL